MESRPKDSDRLKQIAVAGLLSVAAYEIVKYRRTGEHVGHVYKLPTPVAETVSFIVGVITDGREGMARLSGVVHGLNHETGEVDRIEFDSSAEDITLDQMDVLEAVYPAEDSSKSRD